MKTQIHIRAAWLSLLSLLFTFSAYATGSVMGQVTDPDTKQPIDGAVVVFESQGRQTEFYTDAKGFYYASNLQAGLYNVTVTFMGHKQTEPDYKVSNEDALVLDLRLKTGVDVTTVEVIAQRGPRTNPLLDPLDPKKTLLTKETIKEMAITTTDQIAETIGGGIVKGKDGEDYVRGTRAGGLAYYIDGGKVMGSPNIPLCGLDTYRVYNGGIPAKYGDCLGGVVVIETRNYFSEH